MGDPSSFASDERSLILREVVRVLRSDMDLRNVFAEIGRIVGQFIPYEAMGVGLITESGRRIRSHVKLIPGGQLFMEDLERDIGECSLDDTVLEKNRPVLIVDFCQESDRAKAFDRYILERGGRSILSVPVPGKDRVIGVFWISSTQPNQFHDVHVEVVAAMGGLLGLTLEHQRLLEHERQLAISQAQNQQLAEKVERLKTELTRAFSFDNIIGASPTMAAAIHKAQRVAPTEASVLITGESGTGKELMARAIHHHSLRAEGPFAAINCAAIPEMLLESELFGYERGAFSGADKRKLGRVELAQGGTLFLDEIAEMSPVLQAKLLRFLQEREFQRLGGTETLAADVRLIAATNKDLATMVEQKTFRDDLYYRLNVLTIEIPPLRVRPGDVLILTDYILKQLTEKMGKRLYGVSQEAKQALLRHTWRGNIRELQNALEHAVILSDGDLIRPEHLPFDRAPVSADSPQPLEIELPTTGINLEGLECQLIRQALQRTGNNLTRAADLLGIARTSLRSKLQKHGLQLDGEKRR